MKNLALALSPLATGITPTNYNPDSLEGKGHNCGCHNQSWSKSCNSPIPEAPKDELAITPLNKDHLILQDGDYYAGLHLIADFYDAQRLSDINLFREAFTKAVEKAQATLLHMYFHHFTPNFGVSGVAVLAESHISVHTWPERNFAAFDIFMCGDTKPELALKVLTQYFQPLRVEYKKHLRGKL